MSLNDPQIKKKTTNRKEYESNYGFFFLPDVNNIVFFIYL